MKKKVLIVLASFFMTGAGILFQPGEALSHDVNFSFGINMAAPPPSVVVTRPPALYVIPGTPVYYVPEIERQLYFYSGNWYRLYNGYWYRAAYNNGPWMYLAPSGVPAVFIDLSPRYYRVPPRENYRMHWKPDRYRGPREERRYEYRRESNKHYYNNRERGFEGRRNWKHDRTKKRWD